MPGKPNRGAERLAPPPAAGGYARNRSYDDLAPAYRYGWESRGRYANRKYNDVENDLQQGWEQVKSKSQLA